ncbi:TauD/TfdA dioxygenase family protein [Streptomyces sp. NPDC059076]|uniref:TauD/TfdA dioxygenase family protein n=1 Tax=unclassified Streptomyces TaxID=2593676 RepID=UPI003676CBF2
MKLTRLGTYLGAVVEDYQLDPSVSHLGAIVRELLLEYKVVFFKRQHLDRHDFVDVAQALSTSLGAVESHPFKSHTHPTVKGLAPFQPYSEYPQITGMYNDERPGRRINRWHSDLTWRQAPPFASILRGLEMPPVGGNTCWADMTEVYKSLDAPTKARINDLRVVHDWAHSFQGDWADVYHRVFGDQPELVADMNETYPPSSHPLVLTHPYTGQAVLFSNQVTATRVEGMSAEESRELLDQLHRLPAQPEFQCRFSWEEGDIALWDNLATQHYPVADYWPHQRKVERISFAGVAL